MRLMRKLSLGFCLPDSCLSVYSIRIQPELSLSQHLGHFQQYCHFGVCFGPINKNCNHTSICRLFSIFPWSLSRSPFSPLLSWLPLFPNQHPFLLSSHIHVYNFMYLHKIYQEPEMRRDTLCLPETGLLHLVISRCFRLASNSITYSYG